MGDMISKVEPADQSMPLEALEKQIEGVSHESQAKQQMLEHRLNAMEQKVDTMNPQLLISLQTRLETLQSELTELRNLYSSPTSSLNLVLDGLLKKVKDLEASRPSLVTDGGRLGNQNRMGDVHRSAQMGSPSSNSRNNGADYRKLAQGRTNQNGAPDELGGGGPRGSALASAGLMQMGTNRSGNLNN